MDKNQYQTLIKSTVKKAAFTYILEVHKEHSKYRDVKHTALKMQTYMCDSTMSQDDV